MQQRVNLFYILSVLVYIFAKWTSLSMHCIGSRPQEGKADICSNDKMTWIILRQLCHQFTALHKYWFDVLLITTPLLSQYFPHANCNISWVSLCPLHSLIMTALIWCKLRWWYKQFHQHHHDIDDEIKRRMISKKG